MIIFIKKLIKIILKNIIINELFFLFFIILVKLNPHYNNSLSKYSTYISHYYLSYIYYSHLKILPPLLSCYLPYLLFLSLIINYASYTHSLFIQSYQLYHLGIIPFYHHSHVYS
jgi:hypothetical protein